MTWLWLWAVLNAGAAEEKRCPERPIVVRVSPESAPAIKARFESMSSLPYDVRVQNLGKESELEIGYRCAGPKDKFQQPDSLALLQRVAGALIPHQKLLGLRSIRLDFYP